MWKKTSVMLTASTLFLSVGLATPVFADSVTPSATQAISQSFQAVQNAKQSESTDQSKWTNVINQAKSALSTSSTSAILPTVDAQVSAYLQSDVTAISKATSLTSLKSALLKLQQDTAKFREAANKLGSTDNSPQNALQKLVASGQKQLTKNADKINQQILMITSQAKNVQSHPSNKEAIHRLMNLVTKLSKESTQLDQQTANWISRVSQKIAALPQSSTTSGQTSTQASSATSTTTPPAPPAPPTTP